MIELKDLTGFYDCERSSGFIEENKELFQKRFGKFFDFICRYPFVLEYPISKHIEDRCEFCGFVKNFHWYEWNDGYRPSLEEVSISLDRVARIFEMISHVEGELKEYLISFKDEFVKLNN